jgi:hypothetical protein
MPRIFGVWNQATGTLSLSGRDTAEDYQTALRSVVYYNLHQNPAIAGGLAKTITFSVLDGVAVSTQSRNVNIIPTNDPPVVTTDSGPINIPNKVRTPISPGLLVTDPKYNTLVSATVQITGNYRPYEDYLVFTDTVNIKGVFNPLNGMLRLSGVDTVTNYRSALESVGYIDIEDAPITLPRTVSFIANSAILPSNVATRVINVIAIHSPPVIYGIEQTPLAYTQNNPAIPITSTLLVTDGDSDTLSSATIQITGNYQFGEDILSFLNTAKITSSWNAGTGTLTLSGVDSVSNYRTALRNVMFFSTNANPASITKTISFQANDGFASNNLSNIATRTIAVSPVPLLSNIESTPVLYSQQGSGSVQVTQSLTITDANASTLTGAVVRVANVHSGDLLSFTAVGSATGSWDPTSGILTISGTASLSDYMTMLQSVTYANLATSNPNIENRHINFQVFTGSLSSNVVTRDVTFSVTLSNIEMTPLDYVPHSAPIDVSNTISIFDNTPNAILTGAQIQITGSPYIAGSDNLAFTSMGNITGVFFAATGRLVLTGNDTVANYIAALRSVTYQYTGRLPSPQPRTVSFQVSDSSTVNVYTSNIVARTVTVG